MFKETKCLLDNLEMKHSNSGPKFHGAKFFKKNTSRVFKDLFATNNKNVAHNDEGYFMKETAYTPSFVKCSMTVFWGRVCLWCVLFCLGLRKHHHHPFVMPYLCVLWVGVGRGAD